MSLPPVHITRPGDIIGAPPYRAEGCLMHSVVLKGDRETQQKYIDLVFNQPAKGEWTFEVVSDYLLLNAVYVDTMRSLDGVDGPKGVLAETDIGMWTPVVGWPKDWTQPWRTYWAPSFLYVDTPMAMTSGREVYGYPKTSAKITRAAVARDDPTVAVDVLHMPAFGSAKRPKWGRLLEIGDIGPQADDETLAQKILAAWAQLNVLAPLSLVPPSSISMPQLLLRQFRDPFTLGRASIQEALVAEPVALALRGVGLLQDGATLTLGASASHPVMETLGLAATSPVSGFWIEQDFELGAARSLWRNS